MWKVLPKLGLIKVLAFLFSILLLSVVITLLGDANFSVDLSKDNIFQVAAYSGGASLLFLFIVWLLAKRGWQWIWRIPYVGDILNKNVCPDLNGKWEGSISSNFKDESGSSITKSVEMVIKADFIGFDIHLKSKDNYQRSTVVQSEIYKDVRDGVFYMSYVFESVVDQPQVTDDSKFDGAAKLAVRFDGSDLNLVGTYWTNRAWQRGDNTAGKIYLSRVGSK
ncbi:MAG: hypothetical protein P1U35_12790 [Cycloclasticus sp.]|nr:hypothetical protein [Cycloclasticus sp.]